MKDANGTGLMTGCVIDVQGPDPFTGTIVTNLVDGRCEVSHPDGGHRTVRCSDVTLNETADPHEGCRAISR